MLVNYKLAGIGCKEWILVVLGTDADKRSDLSSSNQSFTMRMGLEGKLMMHGKPQVVVAGPRKGIQLRL